jgi:hypothetical protein
LSLSIVEDFFDTQEVGQSNGENGTSIPRQFFAGDVFAKAAVKTTSASRPMTECSITEIFFAGEKVSCPLDFASYSN